MNVNGSATWAKEIKYLFLPYRNFEDENGAEISICDREYGPPQIVCGLAEYRCGQLYMLGGRPSPDRIHMQNGEVTKYRVDRMGLYILPDDLD